MSVRLLLPLVALATTSCGPPSVAWTKEGGNEAADVHFFRGKGDILIATDDRTGSNVPARGGPWNYDRSVRGDIDGSALSPAERDARQTLRTVTVRLPKVVFEPIDGEPEEVAR
jgi:hypothetical protein